MYFLENECMPSSAEEIAFYEDTLQIDIDHHNAMIFAGMYDQQMYLEDGDAKSDDSLFEKMKNVILAMLDKINSLVRGFLDGFKVFSKNRLTAEKYMDSQTGQLRLAGDLFTMQKKIDREYLQLRPLVRKISNATGKDIEDVAKAADKISENVRKYGKTYGKTAVAAVNMIAVNKLAEHCVSQMEDVQTWREETEKSVNRLKRDERSLTAMAIAACSKAMGSIAAAYKNIGSKAMSALQNAKNKK